ncbi:MAG TPA: FliM/FliN family flagellar motor switch protein [Solirubrobacteraceae bacterium]|jgi:flagellar motor switch protein FliN/FliY
MTTHEALIALASSSADAAAAVLRQLAPGELTETEFEVGLIEREAVEALPLPAVVASVAYVNGAQGGNLFVMPVTAARRLAGTMIGSEDLDVEPQGDALSELELSAVGEAMNQMMAAAATATGEVLGELVELAAPDVHVAQAKGDIKANFQGATRMTVAVMTLFGEPCRLVHLIPTVFTMRMTQALASGAGAGAAGDGPAAAALRDALRDVPLRVWAELGRARLRSVDVAALGDGAIVDLDRAADDPVDIFVNGSRIATGRLIRVDETDWAVRLEEVFQTAEPPTTPEGGR